MTVPATLTDLYELTMAAGYFLADRRDEAVFELFVRHLPLHRNFLIAAGLDHALAYLENLHFTPEEIRYLRALPALAPMPAAFFEFLAGLHFTGDVWAMPEGTPVFANEPILTVRAPIVEAQLVETTLLNLMAYPTSVASKAVRVTLAAAGRSVIEFGARRAPGPSAALAASRSGFIGGCIGTSNVEAGRLYEIPVYGTIAHSWVMSFWDEVAAFRQYQRAFPHNAVLLIDTYDTVRAAHRIVGAFKPGEILAVRLDSGDLAELSTAVRRILDAGGFHSTQIMASGDLNEELIARLARLNAPIDSFGVGTELVTVRDSPSLPVVYKLVEVWQAGERSYRMKASEGKATSPGQKQVWRASGKAGWPAGDCVTLWDEPAPAPDSRPLLQHVMRHGRRVSGPEPLSAIAQRVRTELSAMPDYLLDLRSADPAYPVTGSDRLRMESERLGTSLASS